MEQYIDKSAIVAEIERLKECNRKICGGDFDFLKKAYPKHYYSTEIYNDILSFLDTLEVKEVDLEKETKKWWKERLHLNPENQLWMDAHQSVVFAKHFFELGLKAKDIKENEWKENNIKPPFVDTMDGNKYSEPVLCRDKFGGYFIAKYVRWQTGYCGWFDDEKEISITHWKELT